MAKLARPLPPMSEEAKKAALARAFAQKRASIAEGILFNLCGNPGMTSSAFAEPEKIAESAIKITDSFMEKLYSSKEDI